MTDLLTLPASTEPDTLPDVLGAGSDMAMGPDTALATARPVEHAEHVQPVGAQPAQAKPVEAEPARPGDGPDERAQARAAWRDSAAAGTPLTGKELAALFGRSERWGRDRITEARQDTTGDTVGSAGPPTPRRPRAARATGGADRPGGKRKGADNGSAEPVPDHDESARVDADAGNPGDVVPDRRAVVDSAPPPVVPTVGLPSGARLVAWAGFLFGTGISVAANVLYSWLPHLAGTAPAPGVAPQVGAAVWPITLVISVEVLSRVRWPAGWSWHLARYGGTGVVALGAAVISYGHLNGVLAAWHYGTAGAAVGPLVVDGLMTISGFALLAMSDHGNRNGTRRDTNR